MNLQDIEGPFGYAALASTDAKAPQAGGSELF
jgi:hypothetical protein